MSPRVLKIVALVVGCTNCAARQTGSSLAATAASTQEFNGVVKEATCDRDFQENVDRFDRERGQSGQFAGRDGVTISYHVVRHDQERGAIVFVNGWTDSYLYYSETTAALARAGYSVYSFDHRGQGLSGRLLANPQIVHVADFGDYVADLKTFVDTIVNADHHDHVFMIAHSMGGLIGTMYALQYGADIEKLVLSVPMFKAKYGLFPEPVAYSIALGQALLGFGDHYAPTQRDYDPAADSFESNTFTSSRCRYDHSRMVANDAPAIRMGGSSNTWVQRSVEAATATRHRGSSLAIPTLLLQAGQDSFVDNFGQDLFCGEAGPKCQMIRFPSAKHSLWKEADAIQEETLSRVIGFLRLE